MFCVSIICTNWFLSHHQTRLILFVFTPHMWYLFLNRFVSSLCVINSFVLCHERHGNENVNTIKRIKKMNIITVIMTKGMQYNVFCLWFIERDLCIYLNVFNYMTWFDLCLNKHVMFKPYEVRRWLCHLTWDFMLKREIRLEDQMRIMLVVYNVESSIW